MFSENQINESYSPRTNTINTDLASILNTPIPKIKVIVRKRPLNSKEINKKEIDIISIKDNSRVIVSEEKIGLDLTKYIDKKEFLFDNAYNEFSTNEDIYMQNIRPMIFAAFYSKYKITCFAYGQTGSGKTFTMMGASQGGINVKDMGMYMLAGYDIFNILCNDNKFNGFKILVSFYEIYCDKLFDLLNNKNKLETREDKKHNINIIGLSENYVTSLNELMNIINFGLKQRTVGKTGANSDSSRSHGIIQIRLVNPNNKEHGKITFIDLAGSEREVDKININKKTRVDGAEINKSLFALKECIRALDQDKSHTPFRGSKLTLVLRDSFIGDCKILMIANISPGNNSSDHTLNTLRYADRVKELKKNPNNKINIENLQKTNQAQSQAIGNLLNNKRNKENRDDNSLNISLNMKKENKNNAIYKMQEKKRRNSSSSSSSSFHNNLKENKINIGKNKINFNSINNYMNNQNNNNSKQNIFYAKNTNNIFTQSNNTNNNLNKNFYNDNDYNNKKSNNILLNNNNNKNANINLVPLSFAKKENINNNNINSINFLNNNINNNIFNDELSSIKLNQSFCSSSNTNNANSLFELESKNNEIVKSIVIQEALCKESQQMHINALCESLKTEMIIFQQYQKNELQINTYIDSMQNLFGNQINQINDMNNKLEKLKNLINQQAKVANLIDEIKNGQNQKNLVNNLFDLNNLKY